MNQIFHNLGMEINETNGTQIDLLYIKNNDGSIRWIWPMEQKQPLFLHFYNAGSMRAKFVAFLFKLVFLLGLQKWIFAQESLKLNPTQSKKLFDVFGKNWALFTGTVGPNQKYIICEENRIGERTFTKFALRSTSKALVNNEKESLTKLMKAGVHGFQFPHIKSQSDVHVKQSSNLLHNLRSTNFTPKHVMALIEMQHVASFSKSFAAFAQEHNIFERIAKLQENRINVPYGIVKKLSLLAEKLSDSHLDTHFAHGDFTPWNIFTNESGCLFIYDWELSSANMPKAFDAFHFVMQQSILVEHASWSEIKEKISKLDLQPYMSAEDMLKYFDLYLLVNTLYYLEVYEKQSKWHTQVYWLMDIWNQAMSERLTAAVNPRELVILDLFDHLYAKAYAGLKLPSINPEKISEYSDIDIVIKEETAQSALKFLKNHPLIQRLKVSKRSSMTKVMAFTQARQVLSVDFIHQLNRKGKEYMDTQELIDRAYQDKQGVLKVELADLSRFIGLFYGLNNASVPAKYTAYADVLDTDANELDYSLDLLYRESKPLTDSVKAKVYDRASNRGFKAVLNKLNYFSDIVKDALFDNGMLITFSGVDGAGKSTIIEHTKREVEKKLRKRVVVIRHRPSILPILSAYSHGKAAAEQRAASTLPRQGENKSTLSSILRFGYYYVDYLFGQFYIYLKYVLRGYVVLYDRYYFDFINDGVRSNIRLPKWLTRAGYTFLMQPNLNFFLYAKPEVILARKKELDYDTINSLTQDYLSLFQDLGKGSVEQYMPIENIDLNRTMDTISSQIAVKLIKA